jgi:hypothetical protein
MPRIVLTQEIAFAASLDAGNRSMRAAGRKTWSKADQSVASREHQRLWPTCVHGVNVPDCCEETDMVSYTARRRERRLRAEASVAS